MNSLPLAHDRNVTYNDKKKGGGFIKKEKFDKNDRATGMEIVEYYKKVAKQFEEYGLLGINITRAVEKLYVVDVFGHLFMIILVTLLVPVEENVLFVEVQRQLQTRRILKG